MKFNFRECINAFTETIELCPDRQARYNRDRNVIRMIYEIPVDFGRVQAISMPYTFSFGDNADEGHLAIWKNILAELYKYDTVEAARNSVDAITDNLSAHISDKNSRIFVKSFCSMILRYFFRTWEKEDIPNHWEEMYRQQEEIWKMTRAREEAEKK